MKTNELDQNEWGVCGFVSAVQAAAENKKNGYDDMLKNENYGILFPVIKKFCDENPALHAELLNFSEIFGEEYKGRSMRTMLEKMENNKSMEGQNGIGIAMTANAMAKLCKDLGFKNSTFIGTTHQNNKLEFPYKNAIYGLRKKSNGNYRFGLSHWVYVNKSGEIYSWGKVIKVEDLEDNGYDKVTHYLNTLE